MRCIVQRVTCAKVEVKDKVIAEIGKGLLILFAVHKNDTEQKVQKMASKIVDLRIFEDEEGKMNLSLKDICGEVLLVSQFTLYGDVSRGNRPSFIDSARPEQAIPIYELLIKTLRDRGYNVGTGVFGEYMNVQLTNNGPATIVIDL